jgi:hypothetical protein
MSAGASVRALRGWPLSWNGPADDVSGRRARMSPVMAPGRNTRPVALVVSICGVSAARSAART